MATNRFRIVIIGAGAISRVAHVPAALASVQIELVGIVDPDTDRAANLARAYGVQPAIAADADSLDCAFDGAIVATPNDLHVPVARQLIERGVHVLIEKPLATDGETAEAFAKQAASSDVTVAVGFHTRHSGSCRALKRALESSEFGAIRGFAHQDGSRGGWSPLSGYNLDTRRAGGGVLMTTGTHFIDRLIWLWGEPERVSFRSNGTRGPESHCIANFEFNRDDYVFQGHAVFSKVIGLDESTVVDTDAGLLIMHSDAAERLLFRPHASPHLEYEIGPRGEPPDPRGLYQRQLEDFVHACRTKTAPLVDAATGALSARVVSSLYANAVSLDFDITAETGAANHG